MSTTDELALIDAMGDSKFLALKEELREELLAVFMSPKYKSLGRQAASLVFENLALGLRTWSEEIVKKSLQRWPDKDLTPSS